MKNQKCNVYDAIDAITVLRVIHRLMFGAIAVVVMATLATFSLLNPLWAEEEHKAHPEKTITAVRINPTSPKIDGLLDDEVWQHAPASGGFLQREPNEGQPSTEKMTFQIAYDDEALYVGVMCYDSEPNKISARLSRRDDGGESDWVALFLDSHHDHQTGYSFQINAAGVLQDRQMSNDESWGDGSWDGVWEGKASVGDKGWSAEYRIPYHVIRFSPKEEYTWGVNINRHINRKKEIDSWVLVRRGENGWVSRFGHIEDIKGIHPPTHLEFLPFALGRVNGKDLYSSLGGDLRYGLTSSLSLNATVNPDFGQVEADPAVLNLSVFETFFEERRPFFVEGSNIFQSPSPDIVGIDNPFQLFYSRRIGKQPGLFSAPADSRSNITERIERPESTTILGAAKLSGKTASKTSFGLVEAITSNEYATIEKSFIDPKTGIKRSESRQYRVEPLTNYLVGRVQQDVRSNSTVGLTMTAINRDDATPVYTGELGANLKWHKNDYGLFSRLAGSRTGSFDNRRSGYAGQVYMYKFSGSVGGQLYADLLSPEFNVNDLGFMGRSNQIKSGAHLYYQRRTPWTLARRSGFNLNLWSGWNYDRVNLAKGVNFNNWHQLKNYWFFGFGVSRDLETLDDLETRGGPLMIRPAKSWGWVNLGTDESKSLSFFSNVRWGRSQGGMSVSRQFQFHSTIRPASNVQIEVGPSYRSEFNFAQWVSNIDDDDDGQQDHYIFGGLKSRSLDFTTRANVGFTPNLSFQVYIQPFVAVGDYGEIKELAKPESYEFVHYYGLKFNPDFHRRSLRGNMVLRWEYQPGSTIFVVWSQARLASSEDPAFHPFDSIKDSFSDSGSSIFLVKLNYWLGL